MVSDSTLRRQPKSLSEDDQPLHPLTGSIRGIGKGSLGQVLFKSVKSTHTCHFPLFSFTTIVLANHFGQNTSFISPPRLSFTTSFLTALECSLEERRGGYFLEMTNGLILR